MISVNVCMCVLWVLLPEIKRLIDWLIECKVYCSMILKTSFKAKQYWDVEKYFNLLHKHISRHISIKIERIFIMSDLVC